MSYERKLKALENRRQDSQYLFKSFSADSASTILNESYKTANYPDSVKYTLGAMAEVDEVYTKNTFNEGERVKNQIEDIKKEGHSFSFRYQGSTSNNTHIRAHSDIDILVIQEKFSFFQPPTGTSYSGDWIQEQKSLRESCYRKINTAFYNANVDNSGSFSISVTGGSLQRKIDIVPSCWDLDEKYNSSKIDDYKGIRVYNKNISDYNKNYPFLNNRLIDLKDRKCDGNFRSAVRLLKTLKADSQRKIEISSYDIVSLLYHLDDQAFLVGSQYLILVRRIKDYLLNLTNNLAYFYSLKVPDETRKISDKVTLDSLKAITVEVGELENSLVNDLSRVYKSLDESVTIGRRPRMF